MSEIRRSAIKIKQGKRSLFLTSFRVRDFMDGDLYRVDKLDVEEGTGMQRLLNKTRAKSFGTDMVSADEYNEAFLPTSIFLATGGSIDYDEKRKELFFESAEHAGICPLDVVDGQHRIEGLKIAAKENDRLLDFPIYTVIAHKLTESDRMLQFVTVNMKQQAISDGVAQHIIARFTGMLEVADLPYLPKWLRIQAQKGGAAKALSIALYLNSEPLSPWNGRIQLAGKVKERRHVINQATFVKSIKRDILSKTHPLNNISDDEKRQIILRNFWAAVRDIFVDSSDDEISNAVVFKLTGLDFFHSISAPVINHLAKNRIYTKDAIKNCILSAEDYLGPDSIQIMSPDFWKRGSYAGTLNRAGMIKLSAAFAEALKKAGNDDIQV